MGIFVFVNTSFCLFPILVHYFLALCLGFFVKKIKLGTFSLICFAPNFFITINIALEILECLLRWQIFPAERP
jgi:hypothetical protein